MTVAEMIFRAGTEIEEVTLNDKVVGFFVPNKKQYREWVESLVENIEASLSKNYLKKIATARKEAKKRQIVSQEILFNQLAL